jgi:hypothetical protein
MNTGITGAQTILLNQAITLGTLSLQAGTFADGSPTLQAADGSNPQKNKCQQPASITQLHQINGVFCAEPKQFPWRPLIAISLPVR